MEKSLQLVTIKIQRQWVRGTLTKYEDQLISERKGKIAYLKAI